MWAWIKSFFTVFFRPLLNEIGQIPSSLTDDYGALLTTTLRNMQPRLHDNITRSNKLVAWLTDNGRVQREDGGERIKVSLMHAHNTTADIYSGYGEIDTTPQDGITAAFYEWAQIAVSITISRKEERQNSGTHRILGLLQSKTMQAEVTIKELLNNCIVNGRIITQATDGQFGARVGRLDSGASGPLPLTVLVDANNSRAVAVGNINPNTYAFWRNQAAISTATTFAANKQEMNQIYNDSSKGTGGAPDLILGDQRSWEQYFNGLQNQERFIIDNPRIVNILGGSEVLKFRGAAYVWDEVVPDVRTNADIVDSVGTFTLGTEYYLNTQTWRYMVDQETDFITTPFVRPENQDAKTAQILWMGAMGVNNRRKNGVRRAISRSIVA